MNIIKSGDEYKVFGEAIETFDKLPKGTYDIYFSKMTGNSLVTRDDLAVTEKVYGNAPKRVEKILKTFKATNRNLGVILYGNKGSGKSLTSRLLAQKAEYPVLLVDQPTPGLSDFLMSIKQEIIVIFDEFEKHFSENNDGYNNGAVDLTSCNCTGPQTELLSLFDGLDNGKKLFVITCNEKRDLNEYFINRPGRFHYLFTYDVPSYDEIKEYLEDNLNDKTLVEEVLKYSSLIDCTYDTLRAICFDLNLGYGVKETIIDLNVDSESKYFKIIITLSSGYVNDNIREYLTPFSNSKERFWFDIDSLGNSGLVEYNCKDMISNNGALSIPASDLCFKVDKDSLENNHELDKLEIKSFQVVPVDVYKTDVEKYIMM